MKVGETFHWNGSAPWKGVGHDISNDLNTDEMMEAAGLDWTVERVPGFYVGTDGVEYQQKKDVLIRSDRPEIALTEAPKNWHILQNREAFDFFREWVDMGNMRLISAGSLKNGEVVWVLAELKEEKLFHKDYNTNNILFTLSHQYGKAIDIRQTPLRIACNNMISFALQQKGNLTVRWDHRKKFDTARIKRTLNLANFQFDEYCKTARLIGSVRYTDKKLEDFMRRLFPTPQQVAALEKLDEVKALEDIEGETETEKAVRFLQRQEQIDELLKSSNELSRTAKVVLQNVETQPGFDEAPGTWWSAFNAVTFATNHLFGFSNAARLDSIWYGKSRKIGVSALQLAYEFAEEGLK